MAPARQYEIGQLVEVRLGNGTVVARIVGYEDGTHRRGTPNVWLYFSDVEVAGQTVVVADSAIAAVRRDVGASAARAD